MRLNRCSPLRLFRGLHPHAALRGERGCYGGDDGHDEVEQSLPLLLFHGSEWLRVKG